MMQVSVVTPGNRTLSENHIEMESTLSPDTTMNLKGPKSAPSKLRKRHRPHLDPAKSKKVRPANQITTSKAAPSRRRLILDTSDGEVCGEYIQVSATCVDGQDMSNNKYEAKLDEFALYQAKATAVLSDLMPEIRSRLPASVLADLEDAKRELAASRSKEKELEAAISAQCACYESQIVDLKAENKETKQELTVARSKEKELEASISRLTQENKVFSARCVSYESQIVALKAENKETKLELTVARDNEKRQEATISTLNHKNLAFLAQRGNYVSRISALEAENKKTIEKLMVASNKEKVFSAQCASYESQVVALEAECKNAKGELMVADKKYYSLAIAAGYAEGIKEGKTKWLKSVEFLHHLTDASMQYFNYGFDSCQKQAEQQGFVGQLNKDSALKDAPELKRCASSAETSNDANLKIPLITKEGVVFFQKIGANVAGLSL